ncbi:hypothetical protein M2347_002866 [Chryseobacterium sp. H1D6B]|nr:hypothetical protein [Chryseobacterium sp. H1D6B]
MSRLNKIEIKYIIIQIIAFNFIILAFRTFSYLTDVHLSYLFLSSIKNSEDTTSLLLLLRENNGMQILDLINSVKSYQIFGFILGCLISIRISSKLKISRLNSLIIIILSFLIFFIKYFLTFYTLMDFVSLFNKFETYLYFRGCLFLAVSLLLFYLSYRVKINTKI